MVGCGVGRRSPDGGGGGGEVGVAHVTRSETSHRVVKGGCRTDVEMGLKHLFYCKDMAKWFLCAETGDV